jgi:hypothetical protein
MSPKFVLLLYYLLPFAVFGQATVTPNCQIVESAPFGRIYYPENNLDILGNLHFPATNFDFPVSGGSVRQEQEGFRPYDEGLSWPLDHKEFFGQVVYRESLSLTSIIRPDGNKMGVSAAGGVIYAGSNDVFAYTHYGRTGKLIWRTSPIANNMMATRWSLANLSIFRRTASSQFQVN